MWCEGCYLECVAASNSVVLVCAVLLGGCNASVCTCTSTPCRLGTQPLTVSASKHAHAVYVHGGTIKRFHSHPMCCSLHSNCSLVDRGGVQTETRERGVQPMQRGQSDESAVNAQH